VRAEFVPQQTIDEMRAAHDWGDILSSTYERGKDFFLSNVPGATPPLNQHRCRKQLLRRYRPSNRRRKMEIQMNFTACVLTNQDIDSSPFFFWHVLPWGWRVWWRAASVRFNAFAPPPPPWVTVAILFSGQSLNTSNRPARPKRSNRSTCGLECRLSRPIQFQARRRP